MRGLAVQVGSPRVREGEKRIYYPGGGIVECRSADEPNSLRGWGWDLAVLDECAYIQERAWTTIRPALMEREGEALLISTPNGSDWFRELHRLGTSGKPGWESWSFPSHDNPFLPKAELADLEEEYRKKGERVYRQEILAEFLTDGGGVLRNVRPSSVRAPEVGRPGNRYIAFWDTALTIDKNAVSVFRKDGGVLVQVYADHWGEVPFAITQARLSQLRQYPGTLYVDITGANIHRHASIQSTAGLVGPSVSVRGHPFTNPNKDEMTNNMAVLLETGGIQLLDPDKCSEEMRPAVVTQIDELEAWTAHKLPSGNTRYAAPDGEHDDMAVATMAAALLAKEGLSADVGQIWQNLGGAWG